MDENFERSGVNTEFSFAHRYRDKSAASVIGVSNYCPPGARFSDGVYPGRRRRAVHITTPSRRPRRYRRWLRSSAKAGNNYAQLSTGLIPSLWAGRRIDTGLRAAILVAQEERGKPGGLEQEILQKRMVCARTHRLRGWMHTAWKRLYQHTLWCLEGGGCSGCC